MLYPLQYKGIVEKYSSEYKLDSYMVYSLIRVESKFNPYAKSSKNASGLMQITNTTGEYIARLIGDSNFKKDDLYNPDINIKYGCYYFSKLLNDFDGNLNCAIAAYNGGEGNVRRWASRDSKGKRSLRVEDIRFGETKQYVKKVNQYYEIYKFLYTKGYNGIPNFFTY
jgi:soluble lytic murein transglycosylase